jgi:hypothetical protein
MKLTVNLLIKFQLNDMKSNPNGNECISNLKNDNNFAQFWIPQTDYQHVLISWALIMKKQINLAKEKFYVQKAKN